MLLQSVQARLQSMQHRDGAISLLSALSQLVDDLFLPSNTILGDRDVSLGLGKVVLLMRVVRAYRIAHNTPSDERRGERRCRAPAARSPSAHPFRIYQPINQLIQPAISLRPAYPGRRRIRQ
jgi:hypothetical protein